MLYVMGTFLDKYSQYVSELLKSLTKSSEFCAQPVVK